MSASIHSLPRILLLAAASSLAHGQDWHLADAGASPPARRFHGLAFDAARGVSVLFGGTDERVAATFGDTWVFDGDAWSLRATAGPVPRQRFASCFDDRRGVYLVFGGADANGQPLGDTWAWNGAVWLAVPTPASPPPRIGAAMAFDESRGAAVLFGGHGGAAAAPSGDTWELDGSTWRQLSPVTPPPARHGHAMTYDPNRGRTVLFGGFAAGATQPSTATFEWDGTDWSEIGTTTQPSTGVFPSLTFHRVHGVAVLTGSSGAASQRVQTWAFDGVDWHPGPGAPTGLVGRQGHATAYDSVHDAVVLFGGASIALGGARPLADTWEMIMRAEFTPFGQGCAFGAGTASLSAVGDSRPEIGKLLELELGPVAAGTNAAVVLGFDDASFGGRPLPLALDALGLPGCSLFVGIDGVQAADVQGATAVTTVAIPLQAGLVGITFFVQGLLLDPSATPLGATTNAGRAAIGS